MFARIKNSGQHQYLPIVENRREGKKNIQRVISTLGRLDQIQAKGDIETMVRSLSRFSEKVLSRAGRYREVYPEGIKSKDPSPLKVKEVLIDDRRYLVCLNEKQARKDAADRQALLKALEEKI